MDFLHRIAPYRPVLWLFATLGFFGLNGLFIYYAVRQPDVLAAALENPISLVFIVEAFFLVAFTAWVISQLNLRQPGWLVFVIFSVVGGLAFSVPFFLLLHLRKQGRG